MKKTYFRGLFGFQFHLLQKFSDDVDQAVFPRKGGVSLAPYESLNVRFQIGDRPDDVKKNRELIMKSLGSDLPALISADQTHSSNVLVIDEEFIRYRHQEEEVQDTDGFITALPEVFLMVQVADCQGILFFDPVRRIIAAVHAGWKGLVKNIIPETLRIMHDQFQVDPAHVLVGISPSLGPCCSFFSDPIQELPSAFHPFILSDRQVDLWGYAIRQLEKAGVGSQNIELARICTQCDPGKRFFSYRGDRGITGRFGCLIALKSRDMRS